MIRFEPGEVVAGRFVVEGKLASGGMATVYAARMRLARDLEKRVALKRVHPHLVEDADFVAMFIDEARLASQLRHPGVIPVLDAIEVEGELLLVLDLVLGWDLAALLKAEPQLPIPVAARIARMCLETLAYVHDARDDSGRPLAIVHRDVTPANVLLAADGTVRLLDFGIAKAARRATRTATRTLKGKLVYMSPEQARAADVDGRSDVYSVGLTLYEMLTGRRANIAQNDVAAIELAKVPAHAPVERELPDSLREALSRMLAPDREDRPDAATAAALLAGIEDDAEAQIQLVEGAMGSAARQIVAKAKKSAVDAALASLLDDDPETGARSLITQADKTPPESIDGSSEPASEPVLEAEPVPAPVPARASRRWMAIPVILLLALAGGAAYLNASSGESTVSPVEDGPVVPGFVRVSSEPPGATIIIDGDEHSETTPAVLTLERRTEIELRLDDHESVSLPVEAQPGETVSVSRTLERVAGTLVITSAPSGATVTLDGEDRGQTPLTLTDLPRRTLPLRVALQGYRADVGEVDLDAERERTLHVRLQAPGGRLGVNCDIQRVRVFVDGRQVAEVVPWEGRVSAGAHTVRVLDGSGHAEQRRVTVRAGRTANVGFFLRR